MQFTTRQFEQPARNVEHTISLQTVYLVDKNLKNNIHNYNLYIFIDYIDEQRLISLCEYLFQHVFSNM